jgi:hypothetical protein
MLRMNEDCSFDVIDWRTGTVLLRSSSIAQVRVCVCVSVCVGRGRAGAGQRGRMQYMHKSGGASEGTGQEVRVQRPQQPPARVLSPPLARACERRTPLAGC